MARNKLKLNDDKTELLLVAPKHHMNRLLECDPKLKVGEAEIKPASCVRDLGAMLDKHMNMHTQVDQVVRSMDCNIRLISKI